METTATLSRIHPLMAAAAVSLTLVSLVGAAATAAHSATEMANSESAQLSQSSTPAPVVREVI